MKYVVLVDFSFAFHMCWWPAVKAVKADSKYVMDDVVRTNLSGKMRTIERDLREIQITDYDLIFVEDRFPQSKVDLFPKYHHDRPDNFDSKQSLKQYALGNGFNCKFVHSVGYEADDAIATVVNLTRTREDLFAIVCTGDHDLWQLIGHGAAVFDLLTRKIVTEKDVLNKFGVAPNQIALVKALWGDSSDNVPNVMKFQKKLLLPLVKRTTDGSLAYFQYLLEREWSTLSSRCQELYTKGQQQIETNFELVRLTGNCNLTWG